MVDTIDQYRHVSRGADSRKQRRTSVLLLKHTQYHPDAGHCGGCRQGHANTQAGRYRPQLKQQQQQTGGDATKHHLAHGRQWLEREPDGQDNDTCETGANSQAHQARAMQQTGHHQADYKRGHSGLHGGVIKQFIHGKRMRRV